MLFLSSTTKAFTALLAAATLTQALSIDSRAPGSPAAAWSDDNPPTAKVVHVVLFNLKASLNETTKQMFCNDLLSLKEKCTLPTTHKPYILSSTGGQDNSPEGAEHNFTHGFVSQFASLADRDYFVNVDPDHQAWKASHRVDWNDVLVLDFEKGVY